MSRMFGTDGVRGIANSELTVELAYKLGRAGALVLTKENKKPNILVGTDTRISKDLLENALTAGILSTGANVIFVGEIPTPAVAYLTKLHEATAGVVISASHNPVEYNGIKFFDSNGYKLSDDLENRIQELIENDFKDIELPIGNDIGKKTIENNATREYVEYSKKIVKSDFNDLKIAIDCANGACFSAAKIAFEELGAKVYPIHVNPTGHNINDKCGSTHPEDLMKAVIDNGCDAGFAFDGDADRCLAVDENGNLVNGDFMLLITAKYMKENNELKNNTLVVTVMSNLGLHIAAKNHGINIEVTKVGDRYVLENMIENEYIIGGEQSGHIILSEHNSTGDGLATALKLADIIKSSGKKFSEVAKIMEELPQVLVNITIPNEKKNIYLEDVDIINKISEIESNLHGCGRVLIRPSGTEPLIRVMLEGKDKEEITRVANELADLIKNKVYGVVNI